MARIGSEEFYGAATDINQPVIANEKGASEEAYRHSMDNQNRYQQNSRETQMLAAQSNQERERSFGEAISSGLKALPGAFNDARDASNRNALSQQQMKKNQKDLERDEKYGDQKFQNEMEQQKQITESQRLSNDRSKAMQPFEVQRAQADLDNAPLIKQQLQLANKAAGLGNDSLEQQTKASQVAAILGIAVQQARSPQEKQQIIEKTMGDLHGKFDEATLQKGRRLSTTEGFQDQAMTNYITQSDPQFQKAQATKQKLEASANVMAGLKSELAKLENDPNHVLDSPETKQTLENMAVQLEQSGQMQLAASLRQNTLSAFMTPGSPTTQLARAKAAVKSVSDSINNEMRQAVALSENNPYLAPDHLQKYVQAVTYNPNQKLTQSNIIPKTPFGGNNIMNTAAPATGQLGVGAGQFVTSPDVQFPARQQGQQQQQPAQPPMDLMTMPGAKMKNPAQPRK